ncbi:Thymidylate kinase [Strawberry lethal yellows phytoplasma (CPA) str. NZSb11]|uniref:Thymidylate kinase n=1 Tax=Strawberry lethal yellows phytoplasma (CPA) str. NZSb11 TaxID=980422 RepID=R4RPI2_PHYAS|nr:Thymidylate kinase [Strawberry lethal yellows phytoplasma (CPA) str. NZSb11]
MTNKLISFEGVDGSGKTTLINELKTFFENKGYQIKVFQGLGSSIIGKEIRNLFLHQSKICPKTKYLLSLANMMQTQDELIIPALLSGYLVIVDLKPVGKTKHQFKKALQGCFELVCDE